MKGNVDAMETSGSNKILRLFSVPSSHSIFDCFI